MEGANKKRASDRAGGQGVVGLGAIYLPPKSPTHDCNKLQRRPQPNDECPIPALYLKSPVVGLAHGHHTAQERRGMLLLLRLHGCASTGREVAAVAQAEVVAARSHVAGLEAVHMHFGKMVRS